MNKLLIGVILVGLVVGLVFMFYRSNSNPSPALNNATSQSDSSNISDQKLFDRELEGLDQKIGEMNPNDFNPQGLTE